MLSNRLLFAQAPVPDGPQRQPCAPVLGDGQRQLEGGQIKSDMAQLDAQIRHDRTVVRWAGHFWGLCTCGYVTPGYVTEREADIESCEVVVILADSARRKRLLYVGRG